MHVLDTSLLIEIARSTAVGVPVSSRLRGEKVFVASISYYEFLRGAENKELAQIFLNSFPVLEFGREAAVESSRIFHLLKQKGVAITSMDVLITGICIANNATLHTADRDFEKVKGLKLKLY